MPVLHVMVAEKVATYLKRDGAIVCGNSDYEINFTFDSEWNDRLRKTARFIWNDGHREVRFEGNVCPVPILKNATEVEVGVFSGDLFTTTAAVIPCKPSILCTETEVYPEQIEVYRDEAGVFAARAEASAIAAALDAESAARSAIEAAEMTEAGTKLTINGEKQTKLAIDEYVAAAIAPKLDANVAAENQVYANHNGVVQGMPFSYGPVQSTFAIRHAGGQLRTGTATHEEAAVPLAQLRGLLDNINATITSLEASLGATISGLEARVGATITSLEARVYALEPSRNLFNINAYASQMASYPRFAIQNNGMHAMGGYEQPILKFSDVCPKAVIGETYTLSYELQSDHSEYPEFGGIEFGSTSMESGKTFVLTQKIWDSDIYFWCGDGFYEDEEGESRPFPLSGTFANIMLNEGDTALPFEKYDK